MARLSLSFLTHAARKTARTAAIALAPPAMLASCLVTPTPDFQPAPRTAPFLIAESASPKLQGLLVVDGNEKSIDFQALVRSEDGPDKVQVRLFVDYGRPRSENEPYQDFVSGLRLAPSTLDDPTPRTAKASWSRRGLITSGCHTFTLMVSHEFDDNQCPADSDDASSLTWFAYLCEPGLPCDPNLMGMDNCIFQDPPTFCPKTTATTSTSTSTGTAP